MAKFVSNSEGKKAARKENIISLEITYNSGRSHEGEEPVVGYYSLDVLFAELGGHVWSFETDPTLVGIQVKAATILQLLEAE